MLKFYQLTLNTRKKKDEKKSSRETEDGKNSWIRVKNKKKRTCANQQSH
jgi:hypothetical protein